VAIVHQSVSAGNAGDGFLDSRLGILQVHEISGEVLLVGGQVEVAVAAEVKQDLLFLAGLFGF